MLPPKEEEKESKLRELIQLLHEESLYNEKRHADSELLERFLTARQWNCAKAKDMIAANETWRRVNELDNILNWPAFPERPKVNQLLPIYNHKTDRLGRSILFMEFGKCDGYALFKETTEERLLKMLMRRMEKEDAYMLPACLKANPNSKHQLLVITDLKDAYFSQFYQFVGVLKKFIQTDLLNYPENLGCQIFVNAPMIFSVGFAMIKPLLDENTLTKIKVFGSDYKDELLEMVDSANLPVKYGGSCQCAEDCEKSNVGPWNDGTVEGYPIKEWEELELKDLMNDSAIGLHSP